MRALFPVLALALSFVVVDDVQAQEASAQELEGELRTMVLEPSMSDRDREVVRDFLDRADVGEALVSHGLDRERLEARVETLDDGTLAELAEKVRSVAQDGELVGGNTIVISTTTVIIILLLLILVT